ncbi:MAG: hypothetical protein ACYDHH_18160 [Solirubrobacteraceae bacterium]
MKLRCLQTFLTPATVLGALVGVAFTPAAVASAGPVAHTAANCSLAGKYTSLGPTYVEKLTASGTSCATGISLIKAYNRCRLKAGGPKGRCTSKIMGFRFSEKRNSSPVQFVALVRATKGHAVVTFTYTQNT